jgi:hypothetical protein
MRVNVPITVTLDLGTPVTCVPDPLATIKSQRVRLLDIAVIGPLMIWGGVKAGGWGGTVLALFGLTTMGYNARNYARVRDMAAALPALLPDQPATATPNGAQ